MKRETRGRPSKLNDAVTRCICAYLKKGVDQKTACSLAKVPYSTYNEWKARGQKGEEPFVSFFSVISRARDRHKARLLRIVLDAAEGLLPRHADWKAASWLLEKGWPLEYGDRRPLPIPQAEPASIGINMYATLPSGNIAPIDEMLAVSRQWHEKWNRAPIEQHENEPEPKNEPMDSWYNPVTRRIEPIEPIDNGEHEG
jgi:hypothetical protein